MSHRRRAAAASVAVAGALALAGCASPPAAPDLDATGDITIWLSNNEFELAWGNGMVERWNAEHPDEQVTVQEIPAGSTSEEAITAAVTAGTAPCLVYNVSPAAAPQWQEQGGLVDLTRFDGGEQYVTDRTGEAAEQYRAADGGMYQLPWKSNPVMVMYNRAMFEQAGLDPDDPGMTTFDGFLEGSRTLVESGAAPSAIWPAPTSEFFQSWFDFYPLYLATSGGTSLVEDGAATFDDENGRAVWEMWRAMYAEGLAPRESATDDAMLTGATAMQLAGPWAVAAYEGTVDYGFFPVPTAHGVPASETSTFADAKNVSMFTSCQNPGTAWEFLRFTTSVEADGALLEASGQMPMRTDLVGRYPAFFAENPGYVDFADAAERDVDVPVIPNSVEAWQKVRDEYTRAVVYGEGDVDEALADAADAVDRLMEE
ncbi:extracellular solute-binding protein [Isoptericola hypogeus]|uniref:Extracellular solute-binding protein n=1 Tax=Isoptericola hypogeus TaxID=300179 RepID=A0ABP4VB15_9MICO